MKLTGNTVFHLLKGVEHLSPLAAQDVLAERARACLLPSSQLPSCKDAWPHALQRKALLYRSRV